MVLLAVVVLEFVIALFPFQFGRELVPNDVEYVGGVLVTGSENGAWSEGAPTWLSDAIVRGACRINLELRATRAEQGGPAHILAISGGADNGNLVVAQAGADMRILMRRPGSEPNGEPHFLIENVFADRGWHSVRIDIGSDLRVVVDSVTRVISPLPIGTLATWDPDYPLSVGSGPGGEWPWAGELRRAEVSSASSTVDFLRMGALVVPHMIVRQRDRSWDPIRPTSSDDIGLGVVHLLLFAPVGVALRRLTLRGLPHVAVLFTAAALATTIQIAKTFSVGRHAAVADIVWFSAGAVLASWVTATVIRQSRESEALHRWALLHSERGSGGRVRGRHRTG